MYTMVTNQFRTLESVAIHAIGRLEGLSGTARYDLDDEVRAEIKEIALLMKNQIKYFESLKGKERSLNKMSALQELWEVVQSANTVQVGLDQKELDELGLLLDRLEELETYLEAPSLSEDNRKDAETEMESVLEKVHYYSMRA